VRLALGELAGEVLSSQRAVPRKALELGYRFRFPDLAGALRDLLG
jgi:NAD dependent epimerase/dehydratase family enzyme